MWTAVWGEQKFCRIAVRVGMRLQGCYSVAPANITDEALVARDAHKPGVSPHHFSFRSHKELSLSMPRTSLGWLGTTAAKKDTWRSIVPRRPKIRRTRVTKTRR